MGLFNDCDGEVKYKYMFTFNNENVKEQFSNIPICKYHYENRNNYNQTIKSICLNKISKRDKERLSKYLV